MSKDEVIVIGAGGHAVMVAATLLATGFNILGFYADDPPMIGKSILGAPVKGLVSDIPKKGSSKAILGVGSNNARQKLASELDLDWVTAVHPFSFVDPSATVGIGTVICAGAIVQAEAAIGAHVILNTKASVDHHTIVGDYSHIAVAHLAGGARIDEGVFLALHSVVLPGICVGAWSTAGAGAVVTKDVDPHTLVVGVPAQPLKT